MKTKHLLSAPCWALIFSTSLSAQSFSEKSPTPMMEAPSSATALVDAMEDSFFDGRVGGPSTTTVSSSSTGSTRFGSSIISSQRNQAPASLIPASSISLEDFKSSIVTLPSEAALMIQEDAVKPFIEVQKVTSGDPDRNRAINEVLLEYLKMALAAADQDLRAEDFSKFLSNEMLDEPITASRLESILNAIDQVQAGKKSFELSLKNPAASSATLSSKESDECAQLKAAIFVHAMQGRGQSDWLSNYQIADQEWAKADKVWNERTDSQRAGERLAEQLQEARKHLAAEEELRASQDVTKTRFGKLAGWMGKVGNYAASVPEPHLQMLSTGLVAGGSVLSSINEYRINAPVNAAKKVEKNLTKKADIAEGSFKGAAETAPELQGNAQDEETKARSAEVAATLECAKRVLPPTSNNQSEWNTWGDRISKATYGTTILSASLIKQGKNNLSLIETTTAEAWIERLRLSERFAKDLEAKENAQLDKLQTEFTAVNETAKNARAKATSAQEALQQATEACTAVEEAQKKTNQELSDLKSEEKNLRSGEVTKLSQIKTAIADKKSELARMSREVKLKSEEAQKNESATQECVDINNHIAIEAEKKAMVLLDDYTQKAAIASRQLERAMVRVEADKIAWQTVWPQAALKMKLANPATETIATTALETETVEDWERLDREAEEITALCDAVIKKIQNQPALTEELEAIKAQQELWSDRSAIAKGKITFAPMKSLGTLLLEDLRDALKNLSAPKIENILRIAHDIVTQVEPIDHTVSELSISDKGDLAASLRNFRKAANGVTASIKVISSAMGNKKISIEKQGIVQLQQVATTASKAASEAVGTSWQNEAAFVAVTIQQTADFMEKASEQLQETSRSSKSQLPVSPKKTVAKTNQALTNYMLATLKAREKDLARDRAALKKKEENIIARESKMDAERKTGIALIESLSKTLAEERTVLTSRINDLSNEKEKWEKWKEEHNAAVVSETTLTQYQEAMARIEAEEKNIAAQRTELIQREIDLTARTKALREEEEALTSQKAKVSHDQEILKAQTEILAQDKLQWETDKSTLISATEQKVQAAAESQAQAEREKEQARKAAEEAERIEKEATEKIKQAEQEKANVLEAALEAKRQAEEQAKFVKTATSVPTTSASVNTPTLLDGTKNLIPKAISEVIDEVISGGKKRETRMMRIIRDLEKNLNEKRTSFINTALHNDKIAAEEERTKALEQACIEAEKEAVRTAQEKAAQLKQEKEIAERAQALKELSKAITQADNDWKKAIEVQNKADELGTKMESAATKDDFNQIGAAYKTSEQAWNKALESKRSVLEKVTEEDKSVLLGEITMGEANKNHSSKFSSEALEKAKEIGKQAAARVAQLAKATADREAREAKEFSDAVKVAKTAWDKATVNHEQARKKKLEAERTNTEAAYNELTALYHSTAEAWNEACEAKKTLLSKPSKTDKRSLPAEIKSAEEKKNDCVTRATATATKAQEVGQENAKKQAELEILKKKESEALEAARLEASREAARKEIERQARLKIEAKEVIQIKIKELEQLFAESESKAEIARVAGKINEGIFWSNASSGFNNAAEKLRKAVKAHDAGKEDVAERWQEAAALQQQSTKSYAKAVTAYAAGKRDEANNLNNAGNGFYNAAEKLGKAIEAEVAGNIDIAHQWRDAAALQQQSVDFYTKAAVAYSTERWGYSSAGNSWSGAGNSLYNTAEKLGKAIEAKAAGNINVAQQWHDAAMLQQQSIEAYTKAVAAHTVEKKNEGINWFYKTGRSLDNVGNGFYNAAEKLGKAIEAEVSGKLDIAQQWRKTAVLQQQSIEFCTKAVAAYAVEKQDEAASWDDASSCFTCIVQMLSKAIEAEVSGKLDIAQQWREAVVLEQESAELRIKAATSYARGKINKGTHWDKAARAFSSSAQVLGNAIEAEVSGKQDRAYQFREIAVLEQQSANSYRQSAEAYDVEKTHKGSRWGNVASRFDNAAEKLKEAIYNESSGKSDVARQLREAAMLKQQSANAYRKSAEAYDSGKTDKGIIWKDAGNSFTNAAEKIEKVIKAEGANNLELAEKWREIVGKHQQAAEKYQEAMQLPEHSSKSEASALETEALALSNEAEALSRAL